jgi:hypothetical protein
MRLMGGLITLLLVAACAPPLWSRPDTNPEQAAQDLSECRRMAEQTQRRDVDIDTDILASRGLDWQRSGALPRKSYDFAQSGKERSDDIVERCMTGKGYSAGG